MARAGGQNLIMNIGAEAKRKKRLDSFGFIMLADAIFRISSFFLELSSGGRTWLFLKLSSGGRPSEKRKNEAATKMAGSSKLVPALAGRYAHLPTVYRAVARAPYMPSGSHTPIWRVRVRVSHNHTIV